MGDILVSVVITTYHRDFEMVRKSIESVLNQTYSRLEVIVVDDNGPDAKRYGIKHGLERYGGQSRPVYYIQNQVNLGAQVSRNKGILRSQGDLIAFLDDDDCWMTGKTEQQVKAFDKPDVGLVYSKGYQVMLDSRGEIRDRKPYNMSASFPEEVSFKDMLYGDYIGTTSQVMLRREVFASCGLFDPGQPARQDYEMWIRVSRRYRCVGVPLYLFEHAQHTGEQITKSSKKAFDGLLRVYTRYRSYAGCTSRCHFKLLLARQCFQNKMYLKGTGFAMAAGVYLFLAIMGERDELRLRSSLHSKRRKGTAV
ncbi:MAG: glycosyltransferase family 2 protein [Enterocloster bolteae]|uniref:glycosyltransferase family 2 protein n=1 Tax=Enterocloster bolteae TaxID=208479 RepID=UPI0039949FA8